VAHRRLPPPVPPSRHAPAPTPAPVRPLRPVSPTSPTSPRGPGREDPDRTPVTSPVRRRIAATLGAAALAAGLLSGYTLPSAAATPAGGESRQPVAVITPTAVPATTGAARWDDCAPAD
jgi:hypothetical protein